MACKTKRACFKGRLNSISVIFNPVSKEYLSYKIAIKKGFIYDR